MSVADLVQVRLASSRPKLRGGWTGSGGDGHSPAEIGLHLVWYIGLSHAKHHRRPTARNDVINWIFDSQPPFVGILRINVEIF